MFSGMSTFTIFHVVLSLVGILSGFVVLFGLFSANRLEGWTALFLLATVLTSVTGFFFPFHRLLPSHILGVIALVFLAVALHARDSRKLNGAWSRIYAGTAVLALYRNVFVLIVQLFQKVPGLHALAPTQTEQPFRLTQPIFLILFLVFTIAAAKRFRYEQLRAVGDPLHPGLVQSSRSARRDSGNFVRRPPITFGTAGLHLTCLYSAAFQSELTLPPKSMQIERSGNSSFTRAE
jgi:hypothetical protein